jgi:hypothetical protein
VNRIFALGKKFG